VRITNVDTLSSLIDRLITENIKLYFFKKEGDLDKSEYQKIVIGKLKERLNELFEECFSKNKYEYLEEKRTFDENSIVEKLEELIINDINIGEADRSRLKEVQSTDPNLEKLVTNEKRLRRANEGRAKNKNEIDEKFKKGLGG
jgi:hypothetical protein